MNTNIKFALVFAAGAVVGSAVTWKMLKSKYEQIAQDEINFQVERFTRRETELNKELEDVNDVLTSYEKIEKAQVEEYKKTVAERGYTDYSSYSKPDTPEEEQTEEEISKDRPYVITPDEFDENDNYQCINLTYYADGILADDGDYIVDDVDNTVGVDSLNRFGEHANDAVHVRNDRLKCDYEILKVKQTYKEVVGINPHQVED